MNFFDWYFSLIHNTDDKIVLAAWTATLTSITFISKYGEVLLFKSNVIGEAIKYVFTLMLKFAIFSITTVLSLGIINYKTHYYFGGFLSIGFIGITILILTACLIFLNFLWGKRNQRILNIAVYGCYTIQDNKRITIDLGAEEINYNLNILITSVKSNIYSYSNKFIDIKFVTIPKFLPFLWGYPKLNDKIRKKLIQQKHLATLHFIKNEKEKSIKAIINCDPNLFDVEPADRAQKLIIKILSDPNADKNLSIEITVKLYFLIYSQVIMDLLLDNKSYESIHYILDGCSRLTIDVRQQLSFSSDLKSEVETYLKFWEGHIERYRAITLLEQNEIHGAIQSIFKAINQSPYYPYEDYASLKIDYSKKYGIDLVPQMNEYINLIDSGPSSDPNDNIRVMNELKSQVKFYGVTYHYDILKEIIKRSNGDKDHSELIANKLSELDNNSPFMLLTQYEIIKYLEKGKEKINEIYLDRIDECIRKLKEVLRLDPEFSLIYTKIGTLLLMKGVHYKNDAMINEAMSEYQKGLHFLTQLGFKVRMESNV